MVPQFGQFVDHDMTLAPEGGIDGLSLKHLITNVRGFLLY